MQITDEMVRVALDLQHADGTSAEDAMRAALEAALGVQKAQSLEALVADAQKDVCIEELAAALKTSESWIDIWTSHVGRCDGGAKCTCGRTAVLFEARAVPEKWGLK